MREWPRVNPDLQKHWQVLYPEAEKKLQGIRQIEDSFLRDELDLNRAASDIADKVFDVYQNVSLKAMNRAIQATAEKAGWDTLLVGQSGSRSSADLARGMRPFATGIGATSLISAFYHPDIGFAASNKDTVTKASQRFFIQGLLPYLPGYLREHNQDIASLIFNDKFAVRDMVDEGIINGILLEVIEGSFELFAALLQKGQEFPAEGIECLIRGISYMPPGYEQSLVSPAEDVFARMSGSRLSGRKPSEVEWSGIVTDIQAGQQTDPKTLKTKDIGLVYGEKRFPHYPGPNQFHISSL